MHTVTFLFWEQQDTFKEEIFHLEVHNGNRNLDNLLNVLPLYHHLIQVYREI